ncbi:hypothetical protein KBY66_13630 [Synechococcus sp. Tobar12-5m-g]|uniref:hypothetical protein n=1 Tax=unclassified Synechococcus TaxID=2626047 RepID=UPI0020CB7C9B|nr:MULTISPECIES: hypothetical protein [unclassified Synechococcus]MCP9773640.1 hypothetical protein [Synechococcus sp. Tobar12-5m-g]MCP9874613.1 hypothetical protein [Synechococcus sp. Cruz CV-v-12]
MKKHAILFSGLLRCIDNNLFAFLDSCKTCSKIFVVTERSFQDDAEILVSRYDAIVFYIEDAAEADIGISKSQFRILHPEYIKLEYALRNLVTWEADNQHSFEYIHRLRSDCIYTMSFNDYIKPLTETQLNENILLLEWASNYSGRRESMLKLLGHTEFQVKYRTNKIFFNYITTQMNVQALADSSYEDPFLFSFPVAILNSRESIPVFQDKIREEFPSYIYAIESFIRRLRVETIPDVMYECLKGKDSKELVRAYNSNWRPYYPEHVFFLYINYQGLSARSYPLKHSQRSLKFSRHAATPFTVTIFNQIQAGDFGFLETSYSWKTEINRFIDAGGSLHYALDKFTYINLSLLSDSACRLLYDIIDLLDQPKFLTFYRKDFVDSISARGVEPPKCLQLYINKSASIQKPGSGSIQGLLKVCQHTYWRFQHGLILRRRLRLLLQRVKCYL